jgi:hypothetical protein
MLNIVGDNLIIWCTFSLSKQVVTVPIVENHNSCSHPSKPKATKHLPPNKAKKKYNQQETQW